LDDVENDLLGLKIKKWRQNANRREELSSVVKERKVGKGM
jgi:hypothetical protein